MWSGRGNSGGDRGDLHAIVNVSFWLTLARLGGVAANFTFNLLIARLLAPEDVGFVMVIIATTNIFSILTTLNIESGSIRHMLHARESGFVSSSTGFFLFNRRVWMLAAPLATTGYLAGAYIIQAEQVGLLFWAYLAGALTVPIMGMLRINTRHSTALSHQLQGSIPNLFGRPLLLVVGVAVGAFVGAKMDGQFVVLTYAFTALLAAVMQAWFLRHCYRQFVTHERDFSNAKSWLATGFLLSGSLVVVEFFPDLVVSLSALTLEKSAVGQLAISLRLTSFLCFGLAAVDMAIDPKVTRCLALGENSQRDRLLEISSHLKLWPTLVASALLLLLGEWVLGIFGEFYAEGVVILKWLVIIPLGVAALGPNENLLNAAGHQRLIFRNAIAALSMILVLVPLGGWWFGVEGAAGLAVLGFISWSLFNYLTVREVLHLDASILGVWRHKVSLDPARNRTAMAASGNDG